MGVKEAGYPARDYPNHRIRPAVRFYEGGLIYKNSGFSYTGRHQSDWDVESPMHIGQYVVFHEDSTPQDLIVQPAEKASEALARIITNPDLESGMGWTEDEQNVLPLENKAWGEFVPRGATVEDLKVVPQNDAIAVGDYLDCDNTREEFSVSQTPTNWIAISKVPELKSGFVTAIALK